MSDINAEYLRSIIDEKSKHVGEILNKLLKEAEKKANNLEYELFDSISGDYLNENQMTELEFELKERGFEFEYTMVKDYLYKSRVRWDIRMSWYF